MSVGIWRTGAVAQIRGAGAVQDLDLEGADSLHARLVVRRLVRDQTAVTDNSCFAAYCKSLKLSFFYLLKRFKCDF